MKFHTTLLVAPLLIAVLACNHADSGLAGPGSGGAGGSGGKLGSGGSRSGGGGDTAGGRGGTGSGGAGGSERDATDPIVPRDSGGTEAGTTDANHKDSGAMMTIAEPKYPPMGSAHCAPGCADLRKRYAEALLVAQSCTGSSACAFKAPGSLGCMACPAWVSDTSALAPLANEFNDMGCYGCYFDGKPKEESCHVTGCPDFVTGVCSLKATGGGTCINDDSCPANVVDGAPCSERLGCLKRNGYCLCDLKSWHCSTR